ncbi:MAG: hypothetical protein V4649_11540 [Bacteroidota bacterium]
MNIVISSTVTYNISNSTVDQYLSYLSPVGEEIKSIFCFTDEQYCKNISRHMNVLQDIITARISHLLTEVIPAHEIDFGRFVEITFLDKRWMIRTVDPNGMIVLKLLNLLDVINTTIKYQGDLFLYNADFAKQYSGARIISLLRVKGRVTLVGLLDAFAELERNYRDSLYYPPMQEEELRIGLEFLNAHGFVSLDNGKFRLTARGYMIKL